MLDITSITLFNQMHFDKSYFQPDRAICSKPLGTERLTNTISYWMKEESIFEGEQLMIAADILGDFPCADPAAKVVSIFGERLKQRNHFEPRGDAETAGMRIPGTAAAEPALREGLAEA